jgi:phage FluMu protein Com
VAPVAEQTQLRCTGCRRRLADCVNEIRSGSAVIEIRCERCGTVNRVPLEGKAAT